jgi:hypothetical protein
MKQNIAFDYAVKIVVVQTSLSAQLAPLGDILFDGWWLGALTRFFLLTL